MTPLELIKKGITDTDWAVVCDGYEALTGEHLHTKQEPQSQIDRIALQQIYDIVANACEEPGFVPTTTTLDTKRIPKKKKSSHKKRVKKSELVGEDEDEEDSSLILDDSQITPIKFEQGKTGESQFITNELDIDEMKRNEVKARRTQKTRRATPKKYQAECSECSKKFESDRPTGEIGQKCRNCLRGGKSRFNG